MIIYTVYKSKKMAYKTKQKFNIFLLKLRIYTEVFLTDFYGKKTQFNNLKLGINVYKKSMNINVSTYVIVSIKPLHNI